jgi:hypothetical protein
MAVMFNLLGVIQLFAIYKYRDRTGSIEPYLGASFIVFVFFYVWLDYYALLFYRQTREWLQSLPEGSAEAKTLLRLSYTGYRLFLMGLGIGFIILSFCNFIVRSGR